MTRPDAYVVDTQALVWFLTGDGRLSPHARQLLQAAERGEHEIIVPVPVLAELMAVLEQHEAPVSLREVLRALSAAHAYTVVALDVLTLEAMADQSRSLDLHDRAVAAIAILYNAPVITNDERLRAVVASEW